MGALPQNEGSNALIYKINKRNKDFCSDSNYFKSDKLIIDGKLRIFLQILLAAQLSSRA